MFGSGGRVIAGAGGERNDTGPVYDVDAQAHFDRATNIADETLKDDIDTLIVGLKTDGIWTKLDILCVVHDNATDSYLNLRGIANGPDSSNQAGTPAFTTNVGFAINSTNYINLNQAENNGTLYGLYDAHHMAYIQDNGSSNHMYMTTSNFDNSIGQGFAANGYYIFIQSVNGIVDSGNSGGGGGGFAGGSINAIDNRHWRVNDTTILNLASDGYILTATDYYMWSGIVDPGSHIVSVWGVGGGLTATELGDYENRIRTFAQARGFDVY